MTTMLRGFGSRISRMRFFLRSMTYEATSNLQNHGEGFVHGSEKGESEISKLGVVMGEVDAG